MSNQSSLPDHGKSRIREVNTYEVSMLLCRAPKDGQHTLLEVWDGLETKRRCRYYPWASQWAGSSHLVEEAVNVHFVWKPDFDLVRFIKELFKMIWEKMKELAKEIL